MKCRDHFGSYWKRWAMFPEHRSLIPTARYCAAVGEPGRMTETWLTVKDQPIFAWAGLWSNRDEWGSVYTGVMTDNAPELHHIHDRSPVIIDPADWDFWLQAPLEELYRFDQPYSADRLAHLNNRPAPSPSGANAQIPPPRWKCAAMAPARRS